MTNIEHSTTIYLSKMHGILNMLNIIQTYVILAVIIRAMQTEN